MFRFKLSKIFFLLFFTFFIFGIFFPVSKIKAQDNKFYLAAIAASDSGIADQWYLDKIKAPDAWEKTQGDGNVVVAVIDTGVDLRHPDLQNNLWINSGEIPGNGIDDDNNGYVDDARGWNFVENNNLPSPNLQNKYTKVAVEHGTAVAGIIAAEGSNAFAGAGVAWRAKIMPLKAFDEQGNSDTGLVEAALQYAIDQKADIVNMSFVGLSDIPSLREKIKQAYDAGILLVAAAGNENGGAVGEDMDIIRSYPVCYGGANGENWVLGVAATDKDDAKAGFSNYGKDCTDISAPGVQIYSSLFHDGANPDFNRYFGGVFKGTSVAAPQVAGATVLVKALHPNYKNKQLMEVLMQSADNIDGQNPRYLGKLGFGRLNAANAAAAPAISTETPEELSVKYVISPKGPAEPKVWLLGSKGEIIKNFLAFAPAFRGGVNISLGDVDNDGMAEIVAGAGAGGGPHIRIFNLSGELKYQFFAFDGKKRNGVIAAVADTDGDGKNEIIAMEAAGKPFIRIMDESGKILKDNIKIDMAGALGLAAGDVDNDGRAEIVVSAGAGAAGKIKVMDDSGAVLGEFFPFGKNFYGGVNISVADIANSGWAEIIAARRGAGNSEIRAFNYSGRLLSPGFMAYDKYGPGANISSGDRDSDKKYEIIAAPNGGKPAEVKIYDDKFNLRMSFFPLGKSFTKGLNAYIVTRQ